MSLKNFSYLLIAIAIAGCSNKVNTDSNHDDHNHDDNNEIVTKSTEKHVHSESCKDAAHEHSEVSSEQNHNHTEGEITLDHHRAHMLGVKTSTAKVQPISNSLKVTGEVIANPTNSASIVAPTSGKITFNQSIQQGSAIKSGAIIATVTAQNVSGGDAEKAARIRLEAAKKELDRITPLREAGIVTIGEYNAAKEAYDIACNATTTFGNNVVSPISGTIISIDVNNGEYVNAGQTIATVVVDGHLIVRADVPKRETYRINNPTNGSIRSNYNNAVAEGKVTSELVTAVADKGYQPVYLSIKNSEGFHPGDFVEVWLSTADSHNSIIVPINAIVEKLGHKFLYIKIDDDCYERRLITTGYSDGTNVEVTSGLHEGENVVVEGTTFVRLAETANVAPEGHHHH